MQDLVNAIVAKTGVDEVKAEKAIGIILNLVKTQGDQSKVGELLNRLPGAHDLINRHAGQLTGLLAGGMMGGPLAAITKLQAAGLSMTQGKVIADMLLVYARAKAGDDLVRQVAANIPGLSGLL